MIVLWKWLIIIIGDNVGKKRETFYNDNFIMKNASFSNKVFCLAFFQKSEWVWVKPTKKNFIDKLIIRNIFSAKNV